VPFPVRLPPIMPALITGRVPSVGEGFDEAMIALAAPGMEALAVQMVHSIQGDLDPLARPPSPAIAVGIPLDRNCGLDRPPVGYTREG